MLADAGCALAGRAGSRLLLPLVPARGTRVGGWMGRLSGTAPALRSPDRGAPTTKMPASAPQQQHPPGCVRGVVWGQVLALPCWRRAALPLIICEGKTGRQRPAEGDEVRGEMRDGAESPNTLAHAMRARPAHCGGVPCRRGAGRPGWCVASLFGRDVRRSRAPRAGGAKARRARRTALSCCLPLHRSPSPQRCARRARAAAHPMPAGSPPAPEPRCPRPAGLPRCLSSCGSSSRTTTASSGRGCTALSSPLRPTTCSMSTPTSTPVSLRPRGRVGM
jgi:hypothetical protein